MPDVGNSWRLPGAIMLVEPRLGVHDAADAGSKLGAMLARESGRARWTARELGGLDMAPTRDAVNVAARALRGAGRAFADQFLALTFGEAFGGLGHDGGYGSTVSSEVTRWLRAPPAS